MNSKQTKTIGRVATGLLDWAEREGHGLTCSPITIGEGMARGSMEVTFHGTSAPDFDLRVRVGVGPDGDVYETALRQVWIPDLDAMSAWEAVQAASLGLAPVQS